MAVDLFQIDWLGTEGFTKYWNSGYWNSTIGFIQLFCTVGIAMANWMIAQVLWVLSVRVEWGRYQNIFREFALFLAAAGFCRFSEVILYFWPAVNLYTLIKVITMLISVGTLWYMVQEFANVLREDIHIDEQ